MLLNFDILIHLLGWIQIKKDVWSLMRTCRTLKFAGMPHLFRPPISPCSHEQFAAFCSFIDASGPTCGRFLREFTFRTRLFVRAQKTGTLKSFISMFEHAQQLQELGIEHLGDEMHGIPDPSLLQALGTLTGVKDLAIRSYASSFIPVLQSLQSPVVKLDLTFNECVPNLNQVAPMSIIQNFSSSLEQLSLVWYSENFAPHHGAQFLRMTELDITCPGMGLLTIDTLVYSFPNLRVLRTNSCDFWALTWDRAPGDAHRQTNLASHSRRRWESLDYLEGPLEYLYTLGIGCNVGT
ncbi:hypothetical protein PHLCEN_2v309 [Hermanssonia centrifuga]|uniref:F-box domain-containing protein n=1 Tax=Hermanssonia centrifuga TaxID=98765 RepID=A0A2R6S6B7_9APHY|nr:hypothetical protein PHLCEN_2v309 [Hermanssonia centrifuga]